MNPTSVAEVYHEATKYDPRTLASGHRQLDWSRQPDPFKAYPGVRSVELGRFLPELAAALGGMEDQAS